MDEFDEICRRCAPVVYRFLLSLSKDASLADELTAETFYQAYLHIDTFRGDCRVESWLCQIAKNALMKELRRRKRTVPYEETRKLTAPDDIFELLADREQAMRIHASLHRLKEPYREVFTLRVLGELHFRDIAALFGKSESWAKVTFYRAKVKHRRQKRGTLLTVGIIVLIVLLSLTAAAWMNLVRAQHPYIPVVEESVCNLAAGEVQTFADSCDGRRLFTNSTRITVTFRADTPQNGTITLWNITDVTNPYPAMFYEVDGRTARCEFTNLSSAERYFVLCDGLSGDVTLSDGRPTDLWESFLDLLHVLSPR